MATTLLTAGGHKRGRSSSTTTAIARPSSIVLTTRTTSSTLTRASRRDPTTSTNESSLSLPLTATSATLTSGASGAGDMNLDMRSTKPRPSPGHSWWWSRDVARSSMDTTTSESLSTTPSTLFSPPMSPSLGIGTAPLDWSQPAANRSPTLSPLLLVILLFPLSTALVIGSVWTLPIRLPALDDESTGEGGTDYVFPRTISDVRALAWALKGYSETGNPHLAHVLAVLAVTALWKHAWSIPGSVLLNILTGTLLPPIWATLLQTSLTTLGSLLSTILATPLTPIITRYFPSAISLTRSALEGPSTESPLPTSMSTTPLTPQPALFSSSNFSTTTLDSTTQPYNNGKPLNLSKSSKTNTSPWARLAVLRLIGIVPWSGINVACGVCGVAWNHCMLGAFIGTLPWTAVTCQIGDILQTFVSSPISPNATGAGAASAHVTISTVLTSKETVGKLLFLTFISLAPILAKERLNRWLNGSPSNVDDMSTSTSPSSKTGGLEFAAEEEEIKFGGRGKRRRGHQKRFSVEWWRSSLSLGGSSGGKEGEERLELLGVGDRA